MRNRMHALLKPERLLLAALAGTAASTLFKLISVLNPGTPESQIIASRTVPFFEHMLAAAYVTALAWILGGRAAGWIRRFPRGAAAVLIGLTLASGAMQWFFPNY